MDDLLPFLSLSLEILRQIVNPRPVLVLELDAALGVARILYFFLTTSILYVGARLAFNRAGVPALHKNLTAVVACGFAVAIFFVTPSRPL